MAVTNERNFGLCKNELFRVYASVTAVPLAKSSQPRNTQLSERAYRGLRTALFSGLLLVTRANSWVQTLVQYNNATPIIHCVLFASNLITINILRHIHYFINWFIEYKLHTFYLPLSYNENEFGNKRNAVCVKHFLQYRCMLIWEAYMYRMNLKTR